MSADDCAAIIESTKSAVAALGDENSGGGGSSYQAFLRIKVRRNPFITLCGWALSGAPVHRQRSELTRRPGPLRRCRAIGSTGRFPSAC